MPRKAPPMTPPSAARNAPSAKIIIEMREVSMPTPRAICASSTVARTCAPIRVFSITSHSTRPIAAAMAIMKTR